MKHNCYSIIYIACQVFQVPLQISKCSYFILNKVLLHKKALQDPRELKGTTVIRAKCQLEGFKSHPTLGREIVELCYLE